MRMNPAPIVVQQHAPVVPPAENHQPPALGQLHEGFRFARHVDFLRRHPDDKFIQRHASPNDESTHISAGQRHSKATAAIAALGAVKSEMTQTLSHDVMWLRYRNCHDGRNPCSARRRAP